MNAGNKNTPSTHHPRRRNVATLMVGLRKRSHMQKSHPQVVNPRDIAGERKKKKKKKPGNSGLPETTAGELHSSNNCIERRNWRFFFFFCNLLAAPRTVSNTYAPVARAQSCKPRATHQGPPRQEQHVMYHMVRRDSSAVKFGRLKIAFILALFYSCFESRHVTIYACNFVWILIL